MLRLAKPVKLYEWGQGTNTLNQVWNEIGRGTLKSARRRSDGVTEVIVELEAAFAKPNSADDTVKLVQQNSNMTPASEAWGESAIGRLRSAEGRQACIEVDHATKVMR